MNFVNEIKPVAEKANKIIELENKFSNLEEVSKYNIIAIYHNDWLTNCSNIDFINSNSVVDQGRYIHSRKEIRLEIYLSLLIQRRASHIDST